MLEGHALSTSKVYRSIQRGYFSFCQDHNLCPLPLSEQHILRFIAHKAPTVGYNSFKVYLAAIRALHTCNYLPIPTPNTPRIKLVLRALELQGTAPNKKSPLTISHMLAIRSVLASDLDSLAYWAIINLAFFGCFRAGELVTVPGYLPPQVKHITFAQCNGLSYLQLVIKRSKTKPHGFTATVGCTGHVLCAVCSVANYLHIKGITNTCNNQDPLFTLSNGFPITKCLFVNKFRVLLSLAAIDPTNFSGHSMRIGCATLASQLGFSPCEIRDLGKWASDAYLGYIQTPVSHSAAYASRLLCKKTRY